MQKVNKGFTLIEVLVSLVIFAIAILGLGLQLSKNLKTTISNEVHSSVMQMAMQSIEPLNQAIVKSKSSFSIALNNLIASDGTPPFSTNNSQLKSFKISLDSATDRLGNSLLNTNKDNWQPPYNLRLKVTYEGDNNTQLKFYTTHVMVPPEDIN